MPRFLVIFFTAIIFQSPFTTAFAGQLDDYYLKAFSKQSDITFDSTIRYKTAESSESARCGTPLKHGLSRDWNKLEPTTQKVLAKQLDLPVLSGTELTQVSSGGHFKVHYTTGGYDAPTPSGYTMAQWVQQVADAFEYAYSYYLGKGYHMPPTPYDVYLRAFAYQGIYGQTTDIGKIPSSEYPYASSSYIEIDKDFTNRIYSPSTYTPLQSLQVTSAHEFHHAIQYAYNYYFDIWYAEATSTWFEDEVHDDVNQLYSYLKTWFSASKLALDDSDGYDRWIFNRYIAESHGPDVVKSFFEKLAGIAPTGGQDIPMLPLIDTVLTNSYNNSLGTDYFGFAKRVYTRDWSTHTSDIFRIPYYSLASVNSTSITLPHYSYYYNRFPSSSTAQTITLSKTSGIQTALFKNVGGVITEIPANTGGASYTVNDFSTANEVVLLIANTSAVDNQQASFSLNSSPVNGSCGTSNSGTYTIAPTLNLCSTGTASSVTGSGPWSWTCSGINGGSTSSCSANIQVWTINIGTGGNGTVNCTTPVNNGATSSCTVTPASGYQLSTFTDNGVDKKSSVTSNSYSITNVTANHTIATTFSLITCPTGQQLVGSTCQAIICATGTQVVGNTCQAITCSSGQILVGNTCQSNAINGACGTSNGSILTAVPTTDLCTAGTVSTVTTGTSTWNWSCSGTNGGTSASCYANASAITSGGITKAKIFMGADGDVVTVSNSSMAVYGNTGYDIVTIADGVSAVVIDQNIERINFTTASSNYAFKQTGNIINIYNAAGVTLIASVPVQDDTDGTLLSFSDGTASATMSSGVMKLGLLTVSNSTATTLNLFGNAVITVNATGSDNASSGSKTYNITPGTYSYTISNFATGDKLNCLGTQVSVTNSVSTDGTILVSCTGNNLTAQINLTGISTTLDAQVYNQSSFNAVFGAGSLTP